jgi:hypothetical protein
MEVIADAATRQEPTPEPSLEEAAAQALSAQELPLCPHCGRDPVRLKLMFQKFPKGQIASIISCADCRKLLSVQIVGMEPSPIVKPGR